MQFEANLVELLQQPGSLWRPLVPGVMIEVWSRVEKLWSLDLRIEERKWRAELRALARKVNVELQWMADREQETEQ